MREAKQHAIVSYARCFSAVADTVRSAVPQGHFLQGTCGEHCVNFRVERIWLQIIRYHGVTRN
jgi:hypothetical protein